MDSIRRTPPGHEGRNDVVVYDPDHQLVHIADEYPEPQYMGNGNVSYDNWVLMTKCDVEVSYRSWSEAEQTPTCVVCMARLFE